MRPHNTNCIFLVLILATAAVGCGQRDVVNNGPAGVRNLRSVAKAYSVTATRVRPPTCVEDIMPVLKEIGDPGELLRSPRDGQPYVIVWGIDYRKMANRNPKTGQMTIIAYEGTGKAGKRQAIDMGMTVKEYTDDEFEKFKHLGNGPSSSFSRDDSTRK